MLVLVAFLTSVLSAVFGMAGGLVLMGVYAAVLPVASAMVLHGATQIVANGARAALLWRHVHVGGVLRYGLGAGLAALMLAGVRWVPDTATVFVALGLVPFVAVFSPVRADFARTPVLAGVIVGATQLVAGVGGPLLDAFFVRTELGRREVVATKAATQTLSHALKIGYFATLIDGEVASPALLGGLAVAALAGTWLGGRVLERISDADFRKWTRWIVLAIGAAYFVRGVVSLQSSVVRPADQASRVFAEEGEQLGLLRAHLGGVGLAGLVVEAEHVAEAVHEQDTQLALERVTVLLGLATRGLDADHHVAEVVVLVHREREHVGGLVLLAPLGVQVPDERVVAQQDREICLQPQVLEELRGVGLRRPRRVLDALGPNVDHESSGTAIGGAPPSLPPRCLSGLTISSVIVPCLGTGTSRPLPELMSFVPGYSMRWW